jgi:hypothetical protein
MKRYQGNKIALFLALVFLVPLFWNMNTVQASAATPTFNKSSVTIVDVGKTYQLEIKDKVTGSKYKWATSNSKVAKVSSKGVVTSINKGTATIQCKITYPNKKTKTLSCKVTVRIPATEINIINTTLTNGAHRITLGETVDFSHEMLPANTSDKTYWAIAGGDKECISIDDVKGGIVTAKKAGKVILRVTAAKSATKAEAVKSYINDAVIIEVVGPTATVKNVELVSSTELKIVFDSPVNKDTVITSLNKLSPNIELTLKKDTKGVLASDPGDLTASLSADAKTLTVTASKSFEGEYGINFTSKILTTSGVMMEEYYKQLSYTDTVGPVITGVEIDDTGMINIIRFNEPIDITSLKASNATVIASTSASTSAEQITISTLNNKSNYILSKDKKSLSINLSAIATVDKGKTFSVILTGFTDLAGNTTQNYTSTVVLRADNTKKAQAVPFSIVRTSYKTLTATFSRAMSFGGYAFISGGSVMTGVVDPENNKKVNFTITDAEALYTGYKTVSIGFYNSYNVIETDNSANSYREFSVDFTADKTSPVLLDNKYDAETGILTLTYNEDVTIALTSGIFSSTLVTSMDEIRGGTNITYAEVPDLDGKVIQLKMGNMTAIGNYTFTLHQGFVTDSFRNQSLTKSITISNKSGSGSELPGPYMISQSSSNLSEITLLFANKLDVVSAQTASNYTIPGVTILAARLTNNTVETGASVVLTVAEGSIDVTVERPVNITGVMGYAGSYSAITNFMRLVELKDNKKPSFTGQTYEKSAKNLIKLNFSEQIQGTMIVRVTQIYQSGSINLDNTVTVSGNSVNITLTQIPINNSYLRIEILENSITDLSGNATSPIASTIGVVASY